MKFLLNTTLNGIPLNLRAPTLWELFQQAKAAGVPRSINCVAVEKEVIALAVEAGGFNEADEILHMPYCTCWGCDVPNASSFLSEPSRDLNDSEVHDKWLSTLYKEE